MEEPESPLHNELPPPVPVEPADEIPVETPPADEVVIEVVELKVETILHVCGGAIEPADTYCPHCGLEVQPLAQRSNLFVSRHMFILLGYYIFCFVLHLVLEHGKVVETQADFAWVEIIDAAVTLLFAAMGILAMLPLYSFKNVKLGRLALYSVLAIIGSIGVSYITTLMNVSLFNEDSSYYEFFQGTDYPLFYMLISIAVFPAVFEEMAFRGFLYNSIKTLTDDKSAIWVTSLLFAIIHFAFISLFWLIPFALIAANLRKKYNTLWYGMVIHFMFNLTACMIDYFDLF